MEYDQLGLTLDEIRGVTDQHVIVKVGIFGADLSKHVGLGNQHLTCHCPTFPRPAIPFGPVSLDRLDRKLRQAGRFLSSHLGKIDLDRDLAEPATEDLVLQSDGLFEEGGTQGQKLVPAWTLT
jgi:hypothetical protein